MGDSDPVLTYRQLIAEVRRLCVQRQTGWLFITTSDNHSVRFGLQNGAIVALTFRNKTGMEALAAIQQVLKGSPSFSNGLPNPKPQAGLPPTPELLALLQSAATDHRTRRTRALARSTRRWPEAAPSSRRSSSSISDRWRASCSTSTSRPRAV